jgi:hypothetical protein
LLITVLISNFENNYEANTFQDFQNVRIARTEQRNAQWLDNRDFSDDSSWIYVKEGDETDVDAFIGNGTGNYIIHGDSGEMRIDEPLNNDDWQDFNNPEFPISPDTNGSNSAGLYISHQWHESIDQTRNTPSIHWKRNITMPVNMSDYIITGADLKVVFNASVTAVGSNPSQPHIGGIERPGDYTESNPPTIPQFGIGDFATFYVLISDVDNRNSFMLALNQTTDLGQDSPAVWNYTDTLLDVIPENILISYLNSILEYDNYNFTITLGIDIYCEDNEYNVDIDTWDLLIMRSFNLSFTYKKKVDQFTSISWEQTGNRLTGENIQVTNAQLNLEIKINNTWPSNLSPNSDIRILINDKQYTETIKLINAPKGGFELAFPENIDVTSLILKDIDIILAIQIYLADEFGLAEDIKISIDNVYFRIYWNVYISDIFSEPFIFRILLIVSSIAALSIGGYLVAYQKVLKYPKPVRKVRKYRRTLTRSNDPTISILSREEAYKREYKKTIKESSSILKEKSIEEHSNKSTSPQIQSSDTKKLQGENQ